MKVDERDVKDIPITEFNLSRRAQNVLKVLRVYSTKQLAKMSEIDILNTKSCGKKSLQEINNILEKCSSGEYPVKKRDKKRERELLASLSSIHQQYEDNFAKMMEHQNHPSKKKPYIKRENILNSEELKIKRELNHDFGYNFPIGNPCPLTSTTNCASCSGYIRQIDLDDDKTIFVQGTKEHSDEACYLKNCN